MDDEKNKMKSEKDGRENSSSNGDHASKNTSEDEGFAGMNDEKDPVRVLQLSEPFFVADTLEEDESLIIPPTQEDSVSFMVPSTPCGDKSDRKSFDPNDSAVSILEETCIDLENKSEHNNTGKEDANQTSNTTCNESDLTQDLSELEPTEPMLPSGGGQTDFDNEAIVADGKKVEEVDDDEWQLKFSETQTQELLQFNKDKDEDDKEDTQGNP